MENYHTSAETALVWQFQRTILVAPLKNFLFYSKHYLQKELFSVLSSAWAQTYFWLLSNTTKKTCFKSAFKKINIEVFWLHSRHYLSLTEFFSCEREPAFFFCERILSKILVLSSNEFFRQPGVLSSVLVFTLKWSLSLQRTSSWICRNQSDKKK